MDNNVIKISNINYMRCQLQINNITFNSDCTPHLIIEWLKSINYALQYNLPFCLYMPDKFKDNVIVTSDYEVIIYRSNAIFYKISIEGFFFALQLSKAIEENKEKFYKSFKVELNNQNIKKYITIIDNLLAKINVYCNKEMINMRRISNSIPFTIRNSNLIPFTIRFIKAHLIQIRFDKFYLYGSHICEIPYKWLRAIYFTLNNNAPLCLGFDDERTYNTIFAYKNKVVLHIPHQCLYSLYIDDIITFALTVYKQMKRYETRWYNWNNQILNKEDNIQYKQKLKDLFNKLSAEILLKNI